MEIPIATRADWKIEPFQGSETVPYAARFSYEEYDRIARGLVPEVMEDKWFIFLEDDMLYLHRSWTGQGVFKVDFKVEEAGVSVAAAVMTPGGYLGTPGYNARILGFLIDNLLLDRNTEFPRPASMDEPAPGVFQHMVSGTGYKETDVD